MSVGKNTRYHFGVAGVPLHTWKKECKKLRIGYSERLDKLITVDIKHLKSLDVSSEDLTVDREIIYNQAFYLPEQIVISWQTECDRLGINPTDRLSALIESDIIILQAMKQQAVEPTTKKATSMNYRLPIQIVDVWVDLCKQLSIMYSGRMSTLLSADIKTLNPLTTVKLEAVPKGPKKSYAFYIEPKIYSDWMRECDRLNIDYAPRAVLLIKEDIIRLNRLKDSGFVS